MKKLLFIIIVLQLYIVATLRGVEVFPGNSDYRTVLGHIESAEGLVTEIITEDGEAWTVENYTADPDSVLEITFNTNGTPDDLTDDIIVNIAAYTEF